MYNEPLAVVNDVDAPANVLDRPQYLLFQEKPQYLQNKPCCRCGDNGGETFAKCLVKRFCSYRQIENN